jgi:hypothetical protein
MDLAVACGVEHLVTHNVRDFRKRCAEHPLL